MRQVATIVLMLKAVVGCKALGLGMVLVFWLGRRRSHGWVASRLVGMRTISRAEHEQGRHSSLLRTRRDPAPARWRSSTLTHAAACGVPFLVASGHDAAVDVQDRPGHPAGLSDCRNVVAEATSDAVPTRPSGWNP